MKIFSIIIIAGLVGVLLLMYFGGDNKPKIGKSKKSIYDYTFTTITGIKKNISDFRGKKILLVNVASECGFTPQYEDLEKLYQKHKAQLEIIGFPANDFMGQEPGTNEEIQEFCKTRFGVTFTLSQKISVVGNSQADIFKWLSDPSLNGWNTKAPKWNFYKYLIDEKGELVGVYPSTTNPLSDEIKEALSTQ